MIKKTKTLKSLKSKLKKTLPEKIIRVIESYDSFSQSTIPDDAKGFGAHHSACKSAVVHAETLLKLAKWTEDDTSDTNISKENEEILDLLNEARKELDDFEDD